MNDRRSGIYEAVIVCLAVMMVVGGIIGAIWMVTLWAEDRFGAMGSLLMAALGILLLVGGIVLAIVLLGARIYRAGAVDTIRGQQITQQGNTAAVRDITGAIRGEITQRARTEGAFERDVQNWANKKAALMVRDQQQLPAPAAQGDADVEATWYEVRNTQGITYDE